MANRMIVLAHGVLGFGNLGAPFFVHYFNGVAAHLRRQGLSVIEPQVNPVGSVAQRGAQLAAAILRDAPTGEKVDILAHSMGGLDARHALTNVPGFSTRVATLVTIGTPHRGSPVADAIANPADPLFAHIPEPIAAQLRHNAGALHDLTTAVCQQFDAATADAPGVRYLEVAGNASLAGHELLLFDLAAEIGRLHGQINDGVVTRTSALRPGREHLDDWPVDHAGEIGWTLSTPLPIIADPPPVLAPPHLARYDRIVSIL
jgi:triacylglycerol lipase